MTTITKEHAQKIIDAADEVITALAGTNDDSHPDNSEKMCGLWDDLNDRYAPPEVVRELARAMLASMDAEPAGYHVIKECGKIDCSVATLEKAEKTRDFWNKKWTIRPYFYSAPLAPVVPEEMNFSTACNFVQINGMANEDRATLAMRAWNACRAAMLQGKFRDLSQPVDPQVAEYEQIMLQAGNHTEQHLEMVDHSGDANEKGSDGTFIDEGTKQAGNSPVIPDGSFSGLVNSARALLDVLYEFGADEVAISEYVTNLEDALRVAAAPQQEVIGIDLANGKDASVEVVIENGKVISHG